MQIDCRGTNDKNEKIGQSWSGRGNVTYFLNFGPPPYLRKVLARNLKFSTQSDRRGTNAKNEN